MSRELDILAKEYQSKKAAVIRNGISVYRTGITTAASGFLRAVEAECKKQNQANVVLVAVIPEPEKDHTSGYR
jgi:hypothetical protein